MATIDIANADDVSNSSSAHVVAALETEYNETFLRVRRKFEAATITYEYTTDPKLLEQYYKVREQCYREDLHLDDFSGEEDEYDRTGHIIVARKGDVVIGGARLVISTPKNRIKLPLEEEGFQVQELFPDMNLENVGYCEFTRFVVLPEYRKGEACTEISRMLVNQAVKEGCLYQFCISPLLQSRNYRAVGKNIGVLHVIRKDIKVPYKDIYRNLNMKGICFSITYFFPEMEQEGSKPSLKTEKSTILETIN